MKGVDGDLLAETVATIPGTRIEVADSFLTNDPTNKPRPPGLAWEYYLFAERVGHTPKGRERREKLLVTIRGETTEQADAKLLAFTERPDVFVVDQYGKVVEFDPHQRS